ncbi:hypothetical protein CAEBREN_14846 [Caenorhabditis brenneri]|uniref:RGS domain-containing protein n=1 Tax=Caenorhabditis brenneri TaxID=135651 RepID=G0PAS3_CAEBE|nr:hypothetical protein CAEBREN_14846 [Caenorhabditis brenneri]
MVGSHQDVETTRIACKDYVHWREGFEFRLTSKIDEIGVYLYRESDHHKYKRALIGYAFLKGDHLCSKNLVEQWNKQKLLNDFLVIQGLDRSSFKNPSKKDLDQWKTSVFKAIQDQLFETLFQKYCYNTGYMHEISLFKQLKKFRKMRFERRDRRKRVEIAIGIFQKYIKMHAPQRVRNLGRENVKKL